MASLGATMGVAGAMAHSEGALSTDSLPEVAGATDAGLTTQTGEPDPGDAAAAPEAEGASSVDGDFLGSAEFTRWGDVQVEVTVANGDIVDIAAVQLPSDRRSAAINAQAEPILEARAIAIQGSDLDVVSGATYTSEAYAESLQAALDQVAIESGESVAG